MDTGDSANLPTSPQPPRRASTRKRTAALVLGALASVVLAAALGGWWLIRDFEEKFSCPSEDWVASLTQEVEGFLPAGTSVLEAYVIDCDDRRTLYMTVKALDQQAAANETQRAAVAAGWSSEPLERYQTDPEHPGSCLESEFQGLAAFIYIEQRDQRLQLVAGRGQC